MGAQIVRFIIVHVLVTILVCSFRPSLSSDVWAQWSVVFLSEAPLVLCVGQGLQTDPGIHQKCQSGAKYTRNKESLVFSLFLLKGILTPQTV